ncbi:hypothetical protein BH11PLA2_BH11PLA2_29950 [soil metagenome]
MSILNQLIDSNNQRVVLEREVARAGEATVHSIRGEPRRLAKLYHKPPDTSKTDKLQWMLQHSNRSLLNITAWPERLLLDSQSRRTVGFVMPKADGQLLFHLYLRQLREQDFPGAGWRFQIRAAINLAAVFDEVHSAGCIVADINEKNFFINKQAMVTLIDCDSFQVTVKDRTHHCPLATPSYIPPELMQQRLDKLTRTVNHDGFGLAVLIFQLLFLGRHPYAGIDGEPGDTSSDRRISRYRFAHGPRAAQWKMSPPRDTPTLSMLPANVAELFCRAFEPGSQNDRRPRPRDWMNALRELELQTVACKQPGHEHWKGTDCPWCKLFQLFGLDFYIGVGGSVAAFILDTKRLEEYLRQLAGIEFQFVMPDREAMSAGPSPPPTPLPWTEDQIRSNRVVLWAFAEPPPFQPVTRLETFGEPVPLEPAETPCPPFTEMRPPKPATLAIRDFAESMPVRPTNPGPLAFPEPRPEPPQPRSVELPPRPQRPPEPEAFSERRIREQVSHSLNDLHDRFTLWLSIAIIMASAIATVGIFTTLYATIVATPVFLVLLYFFFVHLESDLVQEEVDRQRKEWKGRYQQHDVDVRDYLRDAARWTQRSKAASAAARAATHRDQEQWQQALEQWRQRRERFRQLRQNERDQELATWRNAVKAWQRREAEWNAAEDFRLKNHPELHAWRAAELAWKDRAAKHRQRHTKVQQEVREEWETRWKQWQQRAKHHEANCQERRTQALRDWEGAIQAWENRKQTHQRRHEEIAAFQSQVSQLKQQRMHAKIAASLVFDVNYKVLTQCVEDARGMILGESAAIRREIAAGYTLTPMYQSAVTELERTSRRDAERRHAQLHSILDANISGIKDKLKQLLLAAGIASAADITEANVLEVEQFGPARTQDLLNWQRDVMSKFKFNPAAHVPTGRRQALTNEFHARQRVVFANIIKTLQALDARTEGLRRSVETHATNCRHEAGKWRQAQADYSAFETI